MRLDLVDWKTCNASCPWQRRVAELPLRQLEPRQLEGLGERELDRQPESAVVRSGP